MSSVTINRKQLVSTVKRAQSATATKTTKDVLKLVRVRVRDGDLVVSATDSEIYVTLTADGVANGEFDALLDPHLLCGLIESAGDEDVKLSMSGDKAVIECSGRATLPTVDPVDFPAERWLGADVAWSADSAAICAAMRLAVTACVNTDPRFAFSSVCVDCLDNKVSMVGASTRMMIVADVPATISKPAIGKRLVSQKCVGVLESVSSGIASVKATENSIEFSGDGWSVLSQLMEGQFPAYRKLLPDGHEVKASTKMLGPMLYNHLVRASQLSEADSTSVEIEFSDGSVSLSASSISGEFLADIPSDCNGKGEISVCCVSAAKSLRRSGDAVDVYLMNRGQKRLLSFVYDNVSVVISEIVHG